VVIRREVAVSWQELIDSRKELSLAQGRLDERHEAMEAILPGSDHMPPRRNVNRI
jgi:hypothetical protein